MTPSRHACALAVAIAGLCAAPLVVRAQAPAPAVTPAPSSPSPPPQATGDWDPRSGDAWVDRQLGDINLYAARYRGAFLDELVRYHAAPRALVTELLVERRWAPGDVYYACAVAQLAGRPCRGVVDAWLQGRADGWQAVAARVGLAPDAMSRVKQAITASYARWGRPLAKPAPAAERPKATRKPSAKRHR